MNRKELEQKMLRGIASMLAPEEHQEFARMLASLSDAEFANVVASSMKAYRENPMSHTEFKKAQIKMQEKRGITSDQSALAGYPAKWMPDDEVRHWWKKIGESKPSDSIFLTGKDDTSICRLWQDSVKDKRLIPADLFFSGNVPLMDCEITVDERDVTPVEDGGRVCPFRVVIFSDYEEIAASEEGGTVGAIILPGARGDMFVLLNVMPGIDTVISSGFGVHGSPNEQQLKQITVATMLQGSYAFLATWYGIQIALLHPSLKEVFENPKTMPIAAAKKKDGKKRKRQTRYIKRHIIRSGEIEEAVTGGREFTRHTLAWYVIGHWRHYQNGNKVFIHGYWKGALRALKQNLDEGRDRIVSITEGESL